MIVNKFIVKNREAEDNIGGAATKTETFLTPPTIEQKLRRTKRDDSQKNCLTMSGAGSSARTSC